MTAPTRPFKQSGDPFAGSTSPRIAGNGSLMRLAPVAIRHWNDPARLRDVVARQSRTTHGAPEAVDACVLPPYSPDFNLIEKAFSKLKAMLRKIGERTLNGLWDLIGRLVDIFQPRECANYFTSCGYDPD